MRLDMPIVETKRLLLRPVELSDCCDMYEYYKDIRVMRYLSGQVHKDIEETYQMLERWELRYEKRGVPQLWAMESLLYDKVIGSLSIHTIHDDIGEIGYMLHHEYWCQGLMKEAVSQLVKVGFLHIGLRRIEALCAIENVQSINMLVHCGFRKEGTLRQYVKLQDETYHDMVMMSILKDEWIKENVK